MVQDTGCCRKYQIGHWADQEVVWENKRFIKDRVRSFLHIPLNFGAVMKRSGKPLMDAGIWSNDMVVLSDDESLWGSNVYIELGDDGEAKLPPLHPKAEIVELSGRFVTREFDGPYQKAHVHAKQFQAELEGQGQNVKRVFYFYSTCPKCAKAYGENWIALFAEVDA